MLLAGYDQLRRNFLNLELELLKYIVHDLLVVRQVGFEPLQCLCLVGVTAFIDEFLEFFELLVGHLVGQIGAHTKFQRLVNVLEHAPLLVFGKASEAEFLQEVVVEL